MSMHTSEAAEYSASSGQAALDHLDSLYGYALTLTHNQTEAEDLVQETYLRAVRRLDQLLPDSNLKSWLFVIMRNVWLNQLRHIRSGPRFVELEPEGEDFAPAADRLTEDPYVVYIRKLEREEIHLAVNSLPHLYREIILLRDIEGFSYQEIATLLACPTGTVMSRLARAREKLRRTLAGRQVVAKRAV